MYKWDRRNATEPGEKKKKQSEPGDRGPDIPRNPALPTDLNILRHNGDALGVDGAQVGVLEQAHEVSLSSLLKRQNGSALETKVVLEVLRDLTNQTLRHESKRADKTVVY